MEAAHIHLAVAVLSQSIVFASAANTKIEIQSTKYSETFGLIFAPIFQLL
jgi:hypothetical protein